ncbi:hypothetical protein [Paracoccus sp. SSK6]|uniref:hypothetical protein n=1 Tax=Paracoccus sp. SSK6 TaxID=3143131 RepID=UPI00321A7A13
MTKPTVEDLRSAFKEAYADLISFVSTPNFQALLDDMDALPVSGKVAFVKEVLLDKGELHRRGIDVPEDILIQRSAFGDRRPTLFCVKKYLPDEYHVYWENANLTFDATPAYDVSRDPEVCWRPPIRPDVQSEVIALGKDLESVAEENLVPAEYMGRTAGHF